MEVFNPPMSRGGGGGVDATPPTGFSSFSRECEECEELVILKKKDQRPFSENLTANGPLGKKSLFLFPWELSFVPEV